MSRYGTLRIVFIVLVPFVFGIENISSTDTPTSISSTVSTVSSNSSTVSSNSSTISDILTVSTVPSISNISTVSPDFSTVSTVFIAPTQSSSENSTFINQTLTSTTSTPSTTIPDDTNWSLAAETTTQIAPIDENHDELPDGCSQSLDLEHGRGVFTASDWSPGSVPNDARLNGRGGWIGGFSDVHYLQVDLQEVFRISGLRLQPHAQWPRNILKDFKVIYSIDGFHWKKQPLNSDRRIHTNFNESNFESLNVFSSILTARYIVIHPTSWVESPGPAFRMEFYGCRPPAPSESLLVPVVWRGDITSDATWGPGSPYLVHQAIRIWPGITLTLAPGVEILFANPLSGIFVEGTLIANGTEENPITFQAYDIMSQLTVGGFWQGITFIPGGTEHSSLRYVRISSAGVGIHTMGGLTVIDHITFERCLCGLRVEGGVQSLPHLLTASEFYHNDYGIQVYNTSRLVHLTDLTFHATRFVSLSITYPMLLHENFTDTVIELDDIRVTNASYGISVSSYQSMKLEMSRLVMTDVEYGVYMEFSDSVTSLAATLSESNFTRNSLYSVYVDFKRYARYRWYGEGGNFSVTVENCLFKQGANGLSYFGPESLHGQKSMISIRKCEFRSLLLATILQLQEGSSYFISGNKYIENKDRVLDVTYNALDVTGIITENEIIQNIPNYQPNQPSALIKRSLIGIFGIANAQVHGQVSIEYNIITHNKFSRILDTDLMLTHVSFNVFGNTDAMCELCVRLPWVPNGRFLNATHNWWGHPTLLESRRRVLDFFTDLDLAAADLTPILKEPRVRGASWDSASMYLKEGDDYHNGGIIMGSITFTISENPQITTSIFVPASSSLTLPAGINLKFAKDTGILVEGELLAKGNTEKPIVLESAGADAMEWKGIRLLYSKGASFQHTAVVRSRGIQSVGFVPEIDALDVTYSSGPGLWVYVVQPTSIRLRNSYFMYNGDGVFLQVQGNGTTAFTLDVEECHFEQNRGSGFKLMAGNIAMTANLTRNTIANNGGFGIMLNVSDAAINVIDNIFNETKNENKTDYSFLNIDFDDNCNGHRNITVRENKFWSTTTPLRGLSARTSCIKHPSIWAAGRNVFISNFDGHPGPAASLLFDTQSTPDPWPLSFAITENSFECVRLQGVALRIAALHEEDVVIYGNSFSGCASPVQVTSHFNSHRLALTSNKVTNSGSIVLHATPPTTISANGTRFPTSALDFSYNNVSRGNGSATLKTTGYDAEIVMNLFENPASTYDLWVGDLAPVNATLNWWGTDDFNRIVSRVFDGRLDFTRAQATLFPCLMSKNYSDVSTAFPDVFQVLDGVIGGSVKGSVSLPEYSGPYEVQYPIRIPYGSSLTIPAGTVLHFRNQTGIYALGHLSLNGTQNKWIEMRPTNGSTWKGITIGKTRHEFMRVRLGGADGDNIGRIEAFVADSWVGVCADKFDNADAHVVCKELGFTDSLSTSSVNAGNLKIGLANVNCNGLELSLLDCEAVVDSSVACPNNQIATVVCNSENKKRLRRSAEDGSDNLPTEVNFVRIENADVGIQIEDVDGILINNIEVVKSRGPGIILNPKVPHGVTVIASLVMDGEDIGMDVQGTGPIFITTTNSTRNKQGGLDVKSLAPQDPVELSYCGIIDNKIRGIRIDTDGPVNISKCEIQRNGDLGLALKSREMKFNKTLIEDHIKAGAILNSTRGGIFIANTAFVNNGGTDVSVEISTPSGNVSNVRGLVFTRSGLVNSTYNIRQSSTGERFFAMLVKLNAHAEDGRIPIVFSDCRVLDSFSDGVWILTGRSHVNVQVTNCKFEHINGTAVHIETVGISPELNIEENQFSFVSKETVEVEVQS